MEMKNMLQKFTFGHLNAGMNREYVSKRKMSANDPETKRALKRFRKEPYMGTCRKTADEGMVFVLTEEGMKKTMESASETARDEREIGKPISGYEKSVPHSWFDNGWVAMKKITAIILVITMALSLSVTVEAKKKKVHHYKAEVTCYYPYGSLMEGGYLDAMGNYLDPSKPTCAAPGNFAFGTKFKLGGLDDWRDGHVYEVTDRGGRIITKDDGTVCIDILVSSAEEANEFGRQTGWIEVVEE